MSDVIKSDLWRKRVVWVIGPVLTVLCTLGYELFRLYGGFPLSVAVLLPVLVLAGFLGGSPQRPKGGLYTGLAAAGWLSLYSVYLGRSFERGVVVPLVLVSLAVMVGKLRELAWVGQALQEQAQESELSRSLERLQKLNDMAKDLAQNWERMTDAERIERVVQIHDRISNLQTLAVGWRQLGLYKLRSDLDK